MDNERLQIKAATVNLKKKAKKNPLYQRFKKYRLLHANFLRKCANSIEYRIVKYLY